MTDSLSQYFDGIAAKRLTGTDVDPKTSNQHEIQGVTALRALLGTPSAADKEYFDTRFLYLGDEEEDTLHAVGKLTWYDARAQQPRRSAEYRLYVPDNDVYLAAKPDDLLIVTKTTDANFPLLVLIVKSGSTYESQVRWLFRIEGDLSRFAVQATADRTGEISFIERTILESLGIELEAPETSWLDLLLAQFPAGFPKTREFSAFARQTLPEASGRDDPDGTLLAWMEREELLFRTLEAHIVSQRLSDDFETVEEFISFSLSVHQRRKSRAGYALENHMEEILKANGIRYSRDKVTENKSKPDFVFPSIEQYRDPAFPASRLSMLGVKSTCKDRWRQVLNEAQKIPEKHLLTLEPAISEAQTSQMEVARLQLILPSGLHATYSESQQGWLWSVDQFLLHVTDRQR